MKNKTLTEEAILAGRINAITDIENQFNLQECEAYYSDNSYEAKYKRVKDYVNKLLSSLLKP